MNTLEIELKLCLLPGTALTRLFDLAWWPTAPCQQQFLKTQYFDTLQADFHRYRMALRIRHEDQQYIQTLKQPTKTSHEQLQYCTEWHTVLTTPVPDCDKIPDNILPMGFKDAIASKPLIEIFNTQFERSTWLYVTHDTHIEIALDQGIIEAQGACENIYEIELELKHGSNKQVLHNLAEKIRQTIDVLPQCASKAKRGYALSNLC